MTSMKKLLFTLILGSPLTLLTSPDCYALFVKDPKTGVIKENPQLKVSCSCPCATQRLSNTTCLECRHKVGKAPDINKKNHTVDLVLTKTR